MGLISRRERIPSNQGNLYSFQKDCSYFMQREEMPPRCRPNLESSALLYDNNFAAIKLICVITSKIGETSLTCKSRAERRSRKLQKQSKKGG